MNIDSKFPDLLGRDAHGNEIRLSNYPAETRFIIFFYPKDSTSGCTLEARSLAENNDTFLQMGYQLIGCGGGTGKTHLRFAEKNQLPYPLIVDTDQELCRTAGVWQLKKMAGREYMGIVRTTFVCNHDGTVTDVIRKVRTADAATQLFELLDGRYDINPA